MPERRLGVFAGSRERAESLARELCLEPGFDLVMAKSKYTNELKGRELDVLFVDDSAKPLTVSEQNDCLMAVLNRHGVVYELRRMF